MSGQGSGKQEGCGTPSRFIDSRIGINRLQGRPGKRATFLKLDKNNFIEGVLSRAKKRGGLYNAAR